MLDQILARIKELTAQLENCVANHNFIAGALNELKVFHDLYVKAHDALPAIEAAIPVAEQVAADVAQAIPAAEAIAEVL